MSFQVVCEDTQTGNMMYDCDVHHGNCQEKEGQRKVLRFPRQMNKLFVVVVDVKDQPVCLH